MVKNELKTGGISAPNIGIVGMKEFKKSYLIMILAVLFTLFLAANGATPASSCTDASDNNSLDNDTQDSNNTDCKKDNASSVVPDAKVQPIASVENATGNETNVSGAQIDPLLTDQIPVLSGESITSDAAIIADSGFVPYWFIMAVDSAGDVGKFTSLALDSSGNPHISYLDNTNFDLKYAKGTDGNLWSNKTMDSGEKVGEYTSLALDSSGNPHISYYDFYNANLKYMGSFIETVDSAGPLGEYTSLALDASGHPHISYYDNSYFMNLKYATWNGTWNIRILDSYGVGQDTSLALDASGYPHISYFDITNGDLKYAHFLTADVWTYQSVDSTGVVGRYTSLALDSLGNPHISYYDLTNRNLKYAKWTGSAWNIRTIDSVGDVGQYTSLALDSSGYPHISYFDNSNYDLKYAKWTGSAWSIQTVDSTGYVGQYTSLELDASGNPHISYYDASNGDLKYARIISSEISYCTKIFLPGYYVLTADIINSNASSCINILSSDVVLDGQGHTIDGAKTTSSSGVKVGNPKGPITNVTVKNLNLTDWDYGIYYENTQNGSIENNSLSLNSKGVELLGDSYYNKLINNTANLNGWGFEIISNHNSLTNNAANSNGYGIEIASDYNFLTNNNANSNTYGIFIYNYRINNSLANNTANLNTYGIYIGSQSNNNSLTNNTANTNENGIHIASNYNSLLNNTANNNSNAGIYLNFGSSNNFSNNIAYYNKYGIYEYNGYQNEFSENILSDNNDSGFFILYGGDNNLLNNLIFNNGNGIMLVCSNNNNINDNKITNNVISGINNNMGGECQASSHNNIINNLISENEGNGIHFDGGEFNLISGNTINSNYDGIYLGTAIVGSGRYETHIPSINNNISNNFIENNLDAGMFLSDETYENLIYDNLFNNSYNVFDDSALGNYWNIEKTNISNIVGGYYQGGNFWSDYIGKDIDGDYLGDTMLPYNSSDHQGIINGGDYHPLLPPVFPCGVKITTDTVLNTDILNCRATGIEIAADDITLDCNGHTLSGSEGSNFGVLMNGRKNAAVRNCRINNFYTGIFAFNSTFLNLTNNDIENNQIGLSSEDVYKSDILDNRLFSNVLYGVRFTSSSDNTVNYNVFESNGLGLYFLDPESYYNIIDNNTVNSDIYYHLVNMTGITMQDIVLSAPAVSNLGKISVINSSAMTFKDLTLSNNNESGAGIFLYRVERSNLSNITTSDNTYGIRIESSGNNSVMAKAIRNNYGIYLDLASGNEITDSNVSGNYQGLYLDRSSRNTIKNLMAGNNYNGILLSSSIRNILSGIRSYDNFNGMLLENLSFDNKITGINSSNNRMGIRFDNSSMNRLFHSSIINSDQYDFFSSDNSLNDILNLTINRNVMSFAGYDISLRTTRTNPPEDQRGWIYSIGRYLDVGNNSNNSWVLLNLSYAPSDLGQVREPSLGIHRFDRLSGDWNRVPGSTVYANSDYVSANITTTGTFGISGLIRPTRVVYNVSPCITGDGFYTSIQNAVGAAVNGERIVVCPGNYSENTVTVDKSLDIQSYTGVNGTFVSPAAGDILKVTASNVNITGLTFKNAKDTSAAAIRISGSNVTVSGNTFESNSDGIFISGYNNNVSNNNIVRNTNAGIELGTGSHHNDFTGNFIATNSRGLLAGSSTNNTIRNNTIRDNDNGIHLVSSDGNVLKYNIINSNNNGIYLDSSSFNELSENNLYSHNVTGIWIERSSNGNTIKNNSLQMNKHGITASFSMKNQISYNRLKTSVNGIYIRSSNQSNISQNDISNSSDQGIFVQNSQRLNISTNRVTLSHDRGIHIERSDLNVIADNVATRNSNSSIKLTFSNNNNISRNIVSFNKHGIYIDISRGNTIDNNKAFSNYQSGITVNETSTNNNISNNDISINNLDGIYVLNSDSNTISGNSIFGISIYGSDIDKQDYGITLNSSKSTTINENSIGNNKVGGILLTMAADSNVIRNNTIQENYQGLMILDSDNNQIYYNNFLFNSNTTQCDGGAQICQAYDKGNNYWNTSTIGNHWSDYDRCDDFDANNICDYPYEKITGGKDWYPYATFMERRVKIKTDIINLDEGHHLVVAQLVNEYGYPLPIPEKSIDFIVTGIRKPAPLPPFSGFRAQNIGAAGEISQYAAGQFGRPSVTTNREGRAYNIYEKRSDFTEYMEVIVNVIFEGERYEIDIPLNYEYPDIFLVSPQYQKYFLKDLGQNNELKVYSDWGALLLPKSIDFKQPGISPETIPSWEIYSDSNKLVEWIQDGNKYPRTSITTKNFDMGSLPLGANPMTITAVSAIDTSSSIQDVYWIILEKNKYLEGPDGMGSLSRSDGNKGWDKGNYATYSSSITLNRYIIDSHINDKISSVISSATGRTITLSDNDREIIKNIVRNNRNYAIIAQNIGNELEILYGLTAEEKERVIVKLKEKEYSVIKTLDWLINNEMISLSEEWLSLLPYYDIPSWIPYIGGKYGPDLNSLVLTDNANFNTLDGTASSETDGNIVLKFGDFIGDVDLHINGSNSYAPQGSKLRLIEKTTRYYVKGIVPTPYYWYFVVGSAGLYVDYYADLSAKYILDGESLVFDRGSHYTYGNSYANGNADLHIAKADLNIYVGHGLGFEVSRTDGFQLTNYQGIVIARFDWNLLGFKDHWGRKWICDIAPVIEGGDVECWEGKASEPEGWRLMDRRYVNEHYSEFEGDQAVKEPVLSGHLMSLAQDLTISPALEESSSPTTETLLFRNVYPEAEPQLALNDDNDNMMMVYVYDDITKNISQALEIYYTRWNGSQWSRPSAITSDLRMDVKPDVVYDTNGNAFAAWVAVNNSSLTDTTPLNETIKYTEIAYSKFDRYTNEWTEPELLTHNQFFDYDPILASGQNGKIMSLWYADEDNQISVGGDTLNKYDMNKTIYYSVWNGSSWRPPAVAFNNIPLSNKMEFAFTGDTATAVWGQDTDGNSSTNNDREVMYSTWDGNSWTAPYRFTDNTFEDRLPTVIYDGAQPLLAWESIETTSKNVTVNNTNKTVTITQPRIYYATFNGAWSQPELLTETNQVEQLILTRNPQDNPVLLWQSASVEGTDIFYSVFDKEHNSWGAQKQLTSDFSSDVSYSPVITSNNDIISTYVKSEVKLVNEVVNLTNDTTVSNKTFNVTVTKTGNSSIYFLTHHIFVDLEISDNDITLSNPDPAPGEIVTINANVRNVGDLTLNDIMVRFSEGNPGSEIETQRINSIGSGRNKTVSVMWRIPETNVSQDIYVEIDPINDIAEENETNNLAKITMILPDIAMGFGNIDYTSGRDVFINTTIGNPGHSSARNISVGFYYSDSLTFNNMNRTLINMVNISDIEPDSYENASIVWNPSSLQEGYYYVYMAADPDNKILETDETNNEKMLILKAFPDIAVRDPVFNDVMEGEIKFNLTLSNQGTFDASDVNLKVFGGLPFIINGTEVELNESLVILNVTKPLIRANENITISGTWNAQAGDHEIYAIADPYDLIPERDEFNNIGSIRMRILQKLDFNFLDEVDAEANGLFDHIRADVSASINKAGNYYLTGSLNGNINLNSSNLVYLEPGEQNISLNFSGIKIRESGLNGPFTLKNVTLYDETGIMGRLEGQYNTTLLDPASFESLPIDLTLQFSDSGIDTDGDGLFNYLAVYAGVNVTKAGTYIIQGSLYDPEGNFTDSVFNTTFLNVSNGSVILRFDGLVIRGRGIDGPYNLGSLTVYDQNQDVMIEKVDIYSTKFYNYTDFQAHDDGSVFIHFPCSGCMTPTDPDGDGLYEDINGNKKADFNDVVLFFNYLEWVASNEPIQHFDFNGNGRIDFNDIIKLFEEL